LSKTGFPSPDGTFLQIHFIVPPIESFSFIAFSTSFCIKAQSSLTSPICEIFAVISMPKFASTCIAIAPEITRPIVSRALARPPPLEAAIPNFSL
jgi:hypothetical protein